MLRSITIRQVGILCLIIGGLIAVLVNALNVQAARQIPSDLDQEAFLPLIFSAESADDPQAGTPTPTATFTPSPSPTPTVEATNTATIAPSPSATPTSTPAPVTGFPDGATILTLGDSRVAGNSPAYESYRYELWKNLLDNGWEFDLTGTKTDDANYDLYNGRQFDRDHEGTGGATTADILDTVTETITAESASDIVLLGIGGNDYLDGDVTVEEAIENVNQIVDLLQTANPDVVILVEQIAPAISFLMIGNATVTFNDYNAAIVTLANEQTDDRSTVIAVDMATDWSDSYFADPIHYNNAGAKEVADRYDAALEAFYNDSAAGQ